MGQALSNATKPTDYFSPELLPDPEKPRSPHFEPVDYIQFNLKTYKAVIFGTTTCPWCNVAQDQFKRINMLDQVNKIDLDTIRDTEQGGRKKADLIFNDIFSKTRTGRTVPKVFVCGKYIGGGSEAKTLCDSGVLKKLMEQCDL